MADAARKTGLPTKEDLLDFDPENAAVEETEDGGVVVDFTGGPAASAMPPMDDAIAFDSNLVDFIPEQDLGRLGGELVRMVEEDERSRDDWKKAYARGLNLLGLKYEDRTQPWQGACGAFHPMMLESVLRFNAEAMTDLFPGAGPVKTKIIGSVNDAVERQSIRVRRDLNWQCEEQIVGYREESDMMLFNLPLAGSTFRKFRWNAMAQRIEAEYTLPEHVVMPYAAASLHTTDRFAVILHKTKNWVEAKMASGFYKQQDLPPAAMPTTDATSKQKDKIEGKTNTNTGSADYDHVLYECQYAWHFDWDTKNTSGLPVPYVITVDKTSQKILGVRRNWKDGNPAFERITSLVQHKYLPGFGPYGLGLINVLGSLTESATALLRQLIDAGTLRNLPAGFKTKTARIIGDSTPIGPGEWRDVDTGSATLKESFVPLPYGEPSTVLLTLLANLVEEGRRLGSVADMKIADMSAQNMPVGTALAIIERSMKVMSAVQKRLYESFKREFQVIAEMVRDFMSDMPYPFALEGVDTGATRAQDYDDRVDVIPVADPNATTMAQRIMIQQAVVQLAQQAPQIYDLKAVHRAMINILGSDEADRFIPPDEEVQPRDPITENMDLLTGKPVRAGIVQDHQAHITVHMMAANDPKIIKMLENNPAAPGIIAAANAHILEHMAFQYRKEMEETLGVPLPAPGEPLPEDVEYEISRLAAMAAERLTDKHKAEVKQQEILEAMEDPVIQNEQRALDIKQQLADDKRKIEAAKIVEKEKDRAADIAQTIIKEVSETERSTLAAQVNAKTQADAKQIKAAELASDLTGTVLTEAGKIALGRMKSMQQQNKAKK